MNVPSFTIRFHKRVLPANFSQMEVPKLFIRVCPHRSVSYYVQTPETRVQADMLTIMFIIYPVS